MRRLSCIVLVCILGCGSGVPDNVPLFPVTGNLKVDGKPLENISVTLMPADMKSKLKPGVGVTDKEGNFKIATNGDRGAAEGTYKVTLGGAGVGLGVDQEQSTDPKAQAAITMKKQAELMKTKGRPVQPKYPFPTIWTDPKSSPKTYDVKKEGNAPLNIDI